MQEYEYEAKGVCSTRIYINIDRDILVGVRFESGCDGNLKALSRLVEGMPVTEVIKRLKGISCEDKGTSCPDQLARALEEAMAKKQLRIV